MERLLALASPYVDKPGASRFFPCPFAGVVGFRSRVASLSAVHDHGSSMPPRFRFVRAINGFANRSLPFLVLTGLLVVLTS